MKSTAPKDFSPARSAWQIFGLSAITLLLGSIILTVLIGAVVQSNGGVLNFIYGFFAGAVLAVASGVIAVSLICRRYKLSNPLMHSLLMLIAATIPALAGALLLFGWPLLLLPAWAGLCSYLVLRHASTKPKAPTDKPSHAGR